MVRSQVGYTGGEPERDEGAPLTYEMVCWRNNTHTEAVRLLLDPAQMSFADLVSHVVEDPRVQRLKRAIPQPEGVDRFRRRQTRIAIWARDGSQARVARAVLAEAGLDALVPVLPPSRFHRAEEYHQDFLAEDKAFPDWSADPDDDEAGGGWGRGPGTAWGL